MASKMSFADLPNMCRDKIVQYVDLATKENLHDALHASGLGDYSDDFILRNQQELNCPMCQFQVKRTFF